MRDYESIFHAITADPRYRAGLEFGEPRPGHPEGTIAAHIAELEENLRRFEDQFSADDLWKLKILTHVHDTFKADAMEGVSITHPRSHASLAREFLAEFCDDEDLLAMVQFHDEPYALWRQRTSKGHYNTARFDALLSSIQDWDLFLAFLIIDGCTEGKSREPLQWFFAEIAGKVKSTVTAQHILEE